jgi:hypothetical protein
MLSNRSQDGWLAATFTMAELTYHGAVRSVRNAHGNAVLGLLLNIIQTVMLVGEDVRNAYSNPLWAGGIDFATIGLRTGK